MTQEASPIEGAIKRRRAEPAASHAGDFTLRQILSTMRRRKSVIILTMVLVMIGASLILLRTTPRYTAEALIMIDDRGLNVVNMDSVINGLSGDSESVTSEIQVLRSRALAGNVIHQVRIHDVKEFREAARLDVSEPSGVVATIGRALAPLKALLRGESPADSAGARELASDGAGVGADGLSNLERSRLTDSFLSRLSVSHVPKSRVISVRFASEDPALAASVSNTIVDLYLADQQDSKFQATLQATTWLNERIESVRASVEAAETAVERYRQDNGLLEGKGVTLTEQQISELNTQLILARAARAEADARRRQVRRLVNSADAVESAPAVLESPLIQSLRGQETEVRRRLAELSSEYGDRHPKMINLRAEAKDLSAKIRSEIGKIVSRYDNEVGVARSREASLQSSLNAMKRELGSTNEGGVKLRALEREAEAGRLLLQNLLSRVKETSSQEDRKVHRPDARVISNADVSSDPSYPPTKPVLLLALVLSGGLGTLLAFVLEHLESGFRSGEQIEQATGVLSLGIIPEVRGFKLFQRRPEAQILKRPESAFTESVRAVYWGVRFSRIPDAPKRVLITSAVPREGKTTIACSLAMVQARAGLRVVVLDCDLRRGTVHRLFGAPRELGIGNVLEGTSALDDAIWTDVASGVDVLTIGKLSGHPVTALASEEMDSILDLLNRRYDLVIVDAPPVRIGPDARVLARKVDTTVVAVRWNSTRSAELKQTIKNLTAVDAHIAGVVLSMVDVDRHARYEYEDSGLYAGKLKKYYAS